MNISEFNVQHVLNCRWFYHTQQVCLLEYQLIHHIFTIQVNQSLKQRQSHHA